MIARYVLLVAVMATLVTAAVLVTAGVPAAGDTPNVPALRLEHRSRGPPRIGATRPADGHSSVLSARSASPRTPAAPPVGRARTEPEEHP